MILCSPSALKTAKQGFQQDPPCVSKESIVSLFPSSQETEPDLRTCCVASESAF